MSGKNKIKNIIKISLIGIVFCAITSESVSKVKADSIKDIQEQVHSKDDNLDCLTLQDLRKDGRPDFNSDFYKNGNVYYALDKYSGDLYRVQFIPTENKIEKVEPIKNKEGKTIKYKYFKEYKEQKAKSTELLKLGIIFMVLLSFGILLAIVWF